MGIHVVTLTSWGELEEYSKYGWMFRGQRVADWDLQTSIERCADRAGKVPGNRLHFEQELLRNFRRTYHHYSSHIPEESAGLEWLSLMQHHGAPTRLLDFTYAIYVAAYFAIEAADGDSAIWAVRSHWALHSTIDAYKRAGKDARAADNLHDVLRNSAEEKGATELLLSSPGVSLACPMNPFRLNERLTIQHGVFLMPGSIEDTFMANFQSMPGHDSRENALKIIVPVKMRHDAIRKLFDMNMTRSSLFPGLDGFSQSLGVYHPLYDPPEWRSPAAPNYLDGHVSP